MITTPTVFVLGAGAHCPYQMPDGATLTQNIIDLLPQKKGHAEKQFAKIFWAVYSTHGFPKIDSLLYDFRYRLERAGQSTIDSFLQTHADRRAFPEIGKLAVACVLRPKEFKHQFVRRIIYTSEKPNQDWMSYLFERMFSGCKSIDDFFNLNKISFVTFNYDRTLEYFLCTRLVNTFYINEKDAWQKAQKIPIVHVYGSLGDFRPDLISHESDPTAATEFGDAASSIHLMYEDRAEQAAIDQAKELIDHERLAYLLFGIRIRSR